MQLHNVIYTSQIYNPVDPINTKMYNIQYALKDAHTQLKTTHKQLPNTGKDRTHR